MCLGETDALERELREYVGADAAFALRSHQDALALLAGALELGEGDEVICPGIVSPSVIEAIRAGGARPVFVDIEPDRLTLDPTKLGAALSPRTRGMVDHDAHEIRLRAPPTNEVTAINRHRNQPPARVIWNRRREAPG